MAASIASQGTEVRLAVFRLSRRLRLEKTDDELSDTQFGVLAVLNRHGAHTLSALADRERVTAPSMNRTVNYLEERGYLRRDADEEDRRRSNIVITEAGAAVVRETIAKRDAWLTSRIRRLPPQERAILIEAAEIIGRIAAE
ncbi:MarR family winged helix-turn-helix transcriptional regulator [Microlunatus speluncae]|uniref:MarR family winged helix-turn-helix transcriptional regulator n=1 Tax=Microlunatus speluncae TaxID=2594267 RepID=UPI0012663489|nr:MarR family transcriptional regulator [Microlunatus speluncae]